MANKRRSRSGTRRLAGTVTAESRSAFDFAVPVRWVNTVIGIFLLPLALILTQTFFTNFSRVTLQNEFWATEEFWFFSLGVVLWTITFFGLPRPVLIYVFGHELTHALWVWAMGGRVSKFNVTSEGGHIVTDKHNFWIALAPYFFPLYSIFVITSYGAASLFIDVAPYRQLLFGLIGVTWGFHASFTLWMIPKGQTDLTYHGTFFSLVIIYLMNVLVLITMLIIASPHMSWIGFGQELLANAGEFCAWLVSVSRQFA